MLSIYLLGVTVALLFLILMWAKPECTVTLMGIICGLLSCAMSWITAGFFIYIYYSVKTGNKSKNDNIPLF